MTGKSSFAAFLGLALVVANVVRSGTGSQLTSGSFAWASWKMPLLELGGVVVAVFIADTSDQAANIVIAAFIVLWVLFLINVTAKGSNPTIAKSGAPHNLTSAKTSTQYAPKGAMAA